MAGWREQKRSALADIHRTFEIEGVYLISSVHEPIRVNVRLHQRHSITENTLAAWGNAASMLDMTDRMIFTQAEVRSVASKSHVILGPGEVYVMGPTRPVRETYITVEITQMSEKDALAFTQALDTSHEAYEGILR